MSDTKTLKQVAEEMAQDMFNLSVYVQPDKRFSDQENRDRQEAKTISQFRRQKAVKAALLSFGLEVLGRVNEKMPPTIQMAMEHDLAALTKELGEG